MMEVADLHAKGTLTKAPWNMWARGPAARRYAKQKRAAKSLIHRNLRKGWNGWIAMREEKRRRLVLLKAAAASFANRGLRAATNSWLAMVAEKEAAAAKLAGAGQSWVNRARNAAWRKLSHLGEQRRKVKRAASSLIHRNQRKGWNGWIEMVAEKARMTALLSAAAFSFKNRGLRAAMNGWLSMVSTRAAALLRGGHAGVAFANRELFKGWCTLVRLGRLRANARRAGASLLLRERRKGFNGWRAAVRPGKPPNAIAVGERSRCKTAITAWKTWSVTSLRLARAAHGPFAIAVTQRGVLKAWWR